jgi:protein-tyrosine phosphatase
VLVETPYAALGENFEDLLFRVQVRGYRVLLAHPERNETLRAHPERLAGLVRRGVLVQVTAPGLGPDASRAERRFALRLARDGLAHVVASDAHRVGGPRPVGLRQAVAAVEKARPGLGRWMAHDVPSALLGGTPVPAERAPRRGVGVGSLIQRHLNRG